MGGGERGGDAAVRPDGGDSAGRMNPARPVTRAEGVTLFMRLTKQLRPMRRGGGPGRPATPAALEDITFTVERTEMAVGSGSSSPTASLWGPLYPAH